MEYFSEIYGNYYRAVLAVLARACAAPLTESEISEIITQEASAESAFYITPNLTSGRWALLSKKDGLFYPVTKHDITQPMSTLQRSWLCAMLDDVRCSAFFDDDEIAEIKKALGTPALYEQSKLLAVDVCADGDPFADPNYRLRLRTIIDAIRSQMLIRVSFDGAKGSRITADILPCRLEYSPKDNKMRLLAIKVRYGKAILTMTVNLSRITDIQPSSEKMPEQMVSFDELERFCRHRSHQNEPIVIELTDMRNALERFMVQFSSYDKHTRRIDDTNRYICSIFYNQSDEAELLIRLLSFGVTIKVLSPDSMVEKMRERINRQWEMLSQPIEPTTDD